MSKFEALDERAKVHGEYNDCTVKLTALVLDTSYEDAWNILAELGRQPRRGFDTVGKILPELECMGLNIELVRFYSIKTVKTLERYRLQGRYIVRTASHVLYHEDGKTFDWTEGRQHRIQHVFKVTGTPMPDMIDPSCDRLNANHYERAILSKPRRTRKTDYCWELINLKTGQTVARWKRKPTAKIKALNEGRLYLQSDPKAPLTIRPIR